MARRNEIESYVDALGCPDLFLTFSAADYRWDDLMRFLPRYDKWKTALSDEQIKIARHTLLENLHIASRHFVQRFTAFMNKVVIPKFRIQINFGVKKKCTHVTTFPRRNSAETALSRRLV
jgi:hypothetical protein